MTSTSDFRIGYAPVNGVDMYYEVYAATHYDILSHTDLLLPILSAFLANPMSDRA